MRTDALFAVAVPVLGSAKRRRQGVDQQQRQIEFLLAGVPDNLITYIGSLVGEAIAFYSCFISYSHADKRFAHMLHNTLQAHGIRCWLDEKQLLPGDDLYEQVDRGIRLSDKILLCCSEHSLKPASWVDKRSSPRWKRKASSLGSEHNG